MGEANLCKDCEKQIDDSYQCDDCGCFLCEDCRIDFTTGPGSSHGYCHDCSLCPIGNSEHNMHDDFRCDCGEIGCEECGRFCDICGESFCKDCCVAHECVDED